MTRAKAALRVAAIAACAAALAGCVSLLPKTKPAQLYSFDGGSTAKAEAPSSGPTFGVLRARGGFNRAASGDRILTIAGDQVAFVAEARWVSPAAVLFDEALARAFDDNPGPARLINRGQAGRTDYVLQVDVRDFEAVYDGGLKAAPTVVVRLRANLTRSGDKSLVGDKIFEARVKAGDNRVSAIAAGFDKAVGDVIAQLIAWTNTSGRSA